MAHAHLSAPAGNRAVLAGAVLGLALGALASCIQQHIELLVLQVELQSFGDTGGLIPAVSTLVNTNCPWLLGPTGSPWSPTRPIFVPMPSP